MCSSPRGLQTPIHFALKSSAKGVTQRPILYRVFHDEPCQPLDAANTIKEREQLQKRDR